MILPLDHRPALRTALRQLARGILAFYAHAYSPPRRPPGLGLGATLVLGFAAVAVISVLAMATGAPILAIGIANGARLVVREVRSDRAKRAAAPARAFTRSPDPIQVYGAAWSQAFLESRSLDRSRAESGADLLYRAAHQPPPALRIWTRSPRELFIAESLIQTMLDAVGQGVETTAAWEQALANIKGETSLDAYEFRRQAQGRWVQLALHHPGGQGRGSGRGAGRGLMPSGPG